MSISRATFRERSLPSVVHASGRRLDRTSVGRLRVFEAERHSMLSCGDSSFFVDHQRDRLAAPHPDRPNAPLDRGAQDASLKSFGQDFVTQQHHLWQPRQFAGRQERIACPRHEGLSVDQEPHADSIELAGPEPAGRG